MRGIKEILKKNVIFIYGFLFVISVVPFFIPSKAKKTNPFKHEQFNINLSKINSIDKAIKYVENKGHFNSKHLDTLLYVQAVESFVKKRFYHGLSNYSISENWLAYLSGKIIWSHFSAIVIPDDILKYPEGLCSQQSIVFMEILSKKGIKTRHIGWGSDKTAGHFLVEVFYAKSWHLYDVNMEPEWNKIDNQIQRESMKYFQKNKDVLYKAYELRLNKEVFDGMLETVKFGKINTYPAKNMRLFHLGSKLFVYLLPIVLFLMLIRKIKKSKSKQ